VAEEGVAGVQRRVPSKGMFAGTDDHRPDLILGAALFASSAGGWCEPGVGKDFEGASLVPWGIWGALQDKKKARWMEKLNYWEIKWGEVIG